MSLYARAAFVLVFALSQPVYASIVVAGIRGVVHSSDHRPIAGATVALTGTASPPKESVTDEDGAFEIGAVPIGEYEIRVSKDGFTPITRRLALQSGSTPVLHLVLPVAGQQNSITVSDTAGNVAQDSAAPVTNITREEIAHTPGAENTNSLNMITSSVPGAYVVHDQLHVRGGHQVTWAVDGVPVPNTNIASNVGPQFDPKDADYIEAQRGSYSAEFGDRTYAVFNVVPRTGFERDRNIEMVTTVGSFWQTNDQLSIGNHTKRFAYYASASGNRSDLGLETPTPQILHDRESGISGFSTIFFNPDPNNQLRLVGSVRRDAYQIPNNPEQQASGIRDNETERDGFLSSSWIHTFSPSVLTTVAPFFHYNEARYQGGEVDPLAVLDDRSSSYAGAQMAVNATTAHHNLRGALYGFFQHDTERFGITAHEPGGIALTQNQSLNGGLAAASLEDSYRVWSWLTLTAGVRLTHFRGTISENAADPRVGAALRIPKLNWTLRAFYGRFYQEPPLATIEGPLLEFAIEQGFGYVPLHGERDEERQYGVSIPLRGWTLDGDYFNTHARNYFDHDVLGNANIFFPLTIGGARIQAWEITLASPRYRRGQMHVAYSQQTAKGEGAITGGLTDFSPPSPRFFLDHDQRHTLSVGGNLALPRRAWLSGNLYYGSGFLNGDGPEHLDPHTTFDLSVGKRVGESVSVSVNALNVANRRYLIDNSSTFGGTHFANPREVYVQVKWKFRY